MVTANTVTRPTQKWASPAFLKRRASELQPLLGSVYDPFEYEHEYRDFSPSKKTRFGRKSGEWRFTDRSPSPVATFDPAYDEIFDNSLKTPTPGTETDKPVDLQPTLQRNVNSVPRQESPGVANATFYDGIDTAESTQADFGRKRSSNENDDRDGNSNVSFSVGKSSPEQDSILETRKPRAAIQDTYDEETWSSPSMTADPNKETQSGSLYGREHGPPDKLSSPSIIQPSSPEKASQSPIKSSESGNSITDHRRGSEDDVSLQITNMDSENSIIEESAEEPFSKRAYVPSESVGSSVQASEEHELNEIPSSNLTEGAHSNEPTYMISGPQSSNDAPNYLASKSIDYRYDSSMLSRPRTLSRSPPTSARISDDEAITHVHTAVSNADIATGIMDSQSHPNVPIDKTKVYQTVDNTATEIQRSSSPRAHGPVGQIKDVTLKPVEDRKGFAQGQEDRSVQGTSDPLGKDRDRNMVGRRFEEMRQPSASGHLLGEQTSTELQYTVAGEAEGYDNDDEDEMYGRETRSLNQRTDSASRFNEEFAVREQGTAEDPDVEGYSITDTSQVPSEAESRSDGVEIVNLDEYESGIGDEEAEDLARSESGDYLSEEELPNNEEERRSEPNGEEDVQSEERLGSDIEGDDETSEEEDVGPTNREPGETMDNEEANMHDHPPLVSNRMQALRGDLKSRSGTKTSTVEIIDLESEEEDEPATTAVDVAQASPMWFDGPITDEAPRQAAAVSLNHREHTHTMEISQHLQAQQPDVEVAMTVEKQIHPSTTLSTPQERVVHDTYSEDAALSEAENSQAPSTIQANAAIHPLAWSMKHSPGSKDSAGKTAISPSQSTISGQRGLPIQDSQVVPHSEDSESPVRSLDYREEVTSRERRGPAKQVDALAQLGPGFPTQDESPASPSASLVAQTKTTMLSHDQTSRSSVSAEDGGLPGNQDVPQVYGDGNDEEVVREYSLETLRDDFTQQSQLPTPNDTQTYKIIHEPSDPHSISDEGENTLPTPSLTQRTSELVLPATPALPRKTSLIEKLKEMRSNSARKKQANLANDVPTAASPWFGTSRSSQIAPSSDHESFAGADEETGRDGDVSSDVEQSEVDSQPSLPRRRAESPILDPSIARLPSSSPPPPPEPKAGFRTSLSYFAPLSTLRSHYNVTTSVLALVIASTSVARATAGPKDYHMTLHITDPSSASPPSVTSARIFRPSKFPFPEARQGDAILLRNFRVVSYRKQLGLLSTESSAWAVFRRGEEPQIKGPPVEFGAEERGFARGHWDWWGTVVQQDYVDAVPGGTPEKKGRDPGRGKGRSSLVRHELRDGTTYIDRPKVADNDMHELRDGTVWSDSKV